MQTSAALAKPVSRSWMEHPVERKGEKKSGFVHLPQFLQFLSRAVTKSRWESHTDMHLFSLH